MNIRFFLAGTAFGVIALAVAGAITFDSWRDWLAASKKAQDHDDDHGHGHAEKERVQLSPQARANLRLIVKPLKLESYSRTIAIPGMVVDRHGKSDRGVTAPIAGVVKRVAAVPGDTVLPGDELFVIRLNSEYLQSSQMQLYKTARELEINKDQYKRLEGLAKSGAIAEAKIVELEYEQRRLAATSKGLQFDLAARGLSDEQIQEAAAGTFLTEFIIRAPRKETTKTVTSGGEKSTAPNVPTFDIQPYEVEELKVQPGEQVQAGQLLCTLARHEDLYIEGRVFKHEVPLLELATKKSWPVQAEFSEEPVGHWPLLKDPVKIRFLGNKVDPASQTVATYAPLTNQYREYSSEGKKYRVWRFRPGQRVRLQVPVEQIADVFVLPVDAVVREGPEAFVFRANGDVFDRKPVHILYEDRDNVAIASDGSVNVGNYVAFNGAAQLNRVLKAKAAGGGGHGHDHSGHSH